MRSQVSVAFDPDDYKQLTDLCNKRGESLGAFIRFATLQRAANPDFLVPIVFLDLVTAISFGGMSRR